MNGAATSAGVDVFNKIKAFFEYSETILLARLQYVAGLLLFVLTTVDPHLVATYIPTKWVPLWLIFIGLLTEWARRRKGRSFRNAGEA